MVEIHEVRDVWDYNLESEFALLEQVVRCSLLYGPVYLAYDTEYTGVIASPVGDFCSLEDYHYQTLRCNMELCKVLQVGFSLRRSDGSIPSDVPSLWCFHFEFNPDKDVYSKSALDFLSTTANFSLEQHRTQGINFDTFVEHLSVSGLLSDPRISWIVHRGSFDFGFVIRSLTGSFLPKSEDEFVRLLRHYFPSFYDVRHLRGLEVHVREDSADLLYEQYRQSQFAARLSPGNMPKATRDAFATIVAFFEIRRGRLGERMKKPYNPEAPDCTSLLFPFSESTRVLATTGF